MAWTPVNKPTTDGWADIAKPAESSITSMSGGEPIGLLLALTKTTINSSILTGWSAIAEPTSSIWSLVAKPTS